MEQNYIKLSFYPNFDDIFYKKPHQNNKNQWHLMKKHEKITKDFALITKNLYLCQKFMLMKKILPFSLLIAASVCPTKADVLLPDFSYFEDFQSSLEAGINIPDNWKTYGIGEPVQTSFQNYFGNSGEAPFYRIFNVDGQTAAWSCSSYVYANAADEWLVTPPIHINSDSELIKLTAVSALGGNTNRYRVLVSETGQEQDDFKKTPILNTTLTGVMSGVRSKESYITLNGYANKDIYLAFVNKSEDAGLLGLSEIAVAPYFIEVANLTPSIEAAGTKASISLNVNIRTPQNVDGLTATLSYADQTVTKTYQDVITQSGTRILINFDDITIPSGGLDYSVSITPLIDGVPPTVVTGDIGTPSTSYPPVAVVEEFTGTWCTYCPRGTAFMDYYADNFTGNDGGLKVIGIALHVANDPMMMANPAYLNTAAEISKCNGYPAAFFNRQTLSDPSDAQIIRDMENQTSNSRIKINKVDYASNSDIKVYYEVENSYSKADMNQRVAIVMVENSVKGENPLYSQSNGLSGFSQQAVTNAYGEELWPYFKFFSEQNPLISYSLMEYDHVARGIWPDYYGQLLNDACTAEIPVNKEMTIDMPSQVNIPANTAVIALLIDAESGAIISADEMEAKDFTSSPDAVHQISSEPITLALDGKILNISNSSSGVLNIVSPTGALLLNSSLKNGINKIDLSNLSGVVIVTFSCIDGSTKTSRFIL